MSQTKVEYIRAGFAVMGLLAIVCHYPVVAAVGFGAALAITIYLAQTRTQ